MTKAAAIITTASDKCMRNRFDSTALTPTQGCRMSHVPQRARMALITKYSEWIHHPVALPLENNLEFYRLILFRVTAN